MRREVLSICLLVTMALAGLPGRAMADGGIPYVENLSIKVGQAAVIHGVRGECGQLPTKAKLKPRKLKTGTLTFGREGTRSSRSCGGPTPAIEVTFTATKPGRETFKVEGDAIRMTVTE